LKDVSIKALDKVGDTTAKVGAKIGEGMRKIFFKP
jgi:hypothetical protein